MLAITLIKCRLVYVLVITPVIFNFNGNQNEQANEKNLQPADQTSEAS